MDTGEKPSSTDNKEQQGKNESTFHRNLDRLIQVGDELGPQTNEAVFDGGDEGLIDEHLEGNIASHLAVFADLLGYIESEEEFQNLLTTWRGNPSISRADLANLEALYRSGVKAKSGEFSDDEDPGISPAVVRALKRINDAD